MKLKNYKEMTQEEISNFKNSPSPTVLLDVDDTILRSSEVIISVLNQRYDISPPKKFSDLKDWGYRSIYSVNTKEIEDIFDSEEFWNKVQLNNYFLELLENTELINSFNWIVGTYSSIKNEDVKFNYLKRIFEYFNLPNTVVFYNFNNSYNQQLKQDNIIWGKESNKILNKNYSMSKRFIPFHIDYQIDDNMYCLDTDAENKFLLTNGIKTDYNDTRLRHDSEDNFYIIKDLKEFIEVLSFFKDNII